jgi:hypothetical protein
MERKYVSNWKLYTKKRNLLHAQLLQHSIEMQLLHSDCLEAKLIIEKIKNASKS